MRVIHKGMYPELQLRNEVISICRDYLNRSTKNRKLIKEKSEWEALRAKKMSFLRESFPDALFDKNRNLNVKKVSEFKLDGFRIENVIFESFSGWEVNGTIYLPEKEGIYPGVICPTGHSSKTYPNYQRSAQIFAKNNYIAISFDPPGVKGEISYMNDHFTNGLIGYLTGIWSQTHFVADALAAIDYLETRRDVDTEAGFSITGVSGGGQTALTCAALDQRIKFYAPVCCLSDHEKIHLQDLYTSCPEIFGPGHIAAGLDYTEYLCLAAPKPCFVVAGKKDEIFDYQNTTNLYHQVKKIYQLMGEEEKINLFVDEDSGHAYTARMANAVVEQMNRYIKKEDNPAKAITEEDIYYIDSESLKCRPSNKVNMFTINRDHALLLEKTRCFPLNKNEKMLYIRGKAIKALGIDNEYEVVPKDIKIEEGMISWCHKMDKVQMSINKDIRIPGLFLKRVNLETKVPVLLYADETGKWNDFKQGGILSRSARFLERQCVEGEPAIMSIDLSGFGELEPEPSYYDLAGWNDIDRIITYLSIAAARPVMGRRVRDMLAAINYLQSREDIDESKIMLGGSGIGAIVALHAALIWGSAHKVVCMNMLSHYGSMAEVFPFSCSSSIIIPDVLKHYDLPDIAEVMPANCIKIINPRDSAGNKLDKCRVEKLYEKAIHSGTEIFCEQSTSDAFDQFVYSVLEDNVKR